MSKQIVVLCDGTGKQFGDNNTNVVHTYKVLDGRSANQIVLYDPGIGTFVPESLERHVGDWPGKILSKAFGYGLRENLHDTYCFLMQHYEEGDDVFLLGFSRGAFTVRCLAGMLTRCGLLWPHATNLVPYVIRHYFKTWDDQSEKHAEIVKNFKATFTQDCVPKVVAVWDTVNSFGLWRGAKFPNAQLNPNIPFGFQALALDEFRVKFRPSLWQPPTPNQTIEQVWFAGAHSDVGGGYPERQLSDIALKWLLERTEQEGLRLVSGWQQKLDPDPKGQMHDETEKWRWKFVNGVSRLFGKEAERDIPEDAVLDPNVKQRQKHFPNYRPGKRRE